LPQHDRSPIKSHLGLHPETPLVLYHGSVTAGRGLDTLIAAIETDRLAGAHLAIMGYGPLRPLLQHQAESSTAADRIHFLPPVPPADVTTWVAGADVAAMPIEPTTLNHRLSSPNKLFEAMAAGVPIVGPDFPEFRRFVIEGPWGPLGRLYAIHAVSGLASAIAHILSLRPDDRAAIRAACRDAARQRWSWEHERVALLSVYDGLEVPLTHDAPQPATFDRTPLSVSRADR
jgi:glycosyltransferase involved in cell wall biosynthesis